MSHGRNQSPGAGKWGKAVGGADAVLFDFASDQFVGVGQFLISVAEFDAVDIHSNRRATFGPDSDVTASAA